MLLVSTKVCQRSAVAQWKGVILWVEGSLIRDSPEALCCVLEQGTYNYVLDFLLEKNLFLDVVMIYINILFELPLDPLLDYSSVRFVRIFF